MRHMIIQFIDELLSVYSRVFASFSVQVLGEHRTRPEFFRTQVLTNLFLVFINEQPAPMRCFPYLVSDQFC